MYASSLTDLPIRTLHYFVWYFTSYTLEAIEHMPRFQLESLLETTGKAWEALSLFNEATDYIDKYQASYHFYVEAPHDNACRLIPFETLLYQFDQAELFGRAVFTMLMECDHLQADLGMCYAIKHRHAKIHPHF